MSVELFRRARRAETRAERAKTGVAFGSNFSIRRCVERFADSLREHARESESPAASA